MSNETITSLTDFASVAGVSRGTVYKWRNRDDFPPKPKSGWNAGSVREYAKQRLAHAAKCQEGQNSDLKAIRLQRQIERLEVQNAIDGERLKREKLETDKEQGLLVERAEVDADIAQAGKALRHCIDAFRQHTIAKHPVHYEFINTLCDQFREAIHATLLEMEDEDDE